MVVRALGWFSRVLKEVVIALVGECYSVPGGYKVIAKASLGCSRLLLVC